MGKLTDILRNGSDDDFRRKWNETKIAEDFAPLPRGEYVARIINGELTNSRTNGTPGYKLTFKVVEGDYCDRQFWHNIWLTDAALPMAKRDLAKLGVTDLEQLERPLPAGIRCSVTLVLRCDDDGSKYNRVRRFDVLGIEELERDAFAPDDATGNSPGESSPELTDEHF